MICRYYKNEQAGLGLGVWLLVSVLFWPYVPATQSISQFPQSIKKYQHFPHNKKWINVNQRKSSPAVTEKWEHAGQALRWLKRTLEMSS